MTIPMCNKCGRPSDKMRGPRPLCAIHFRMECMRECARAKGKYVPTWTELDVLVAETLQNNMLCPSCKTTMIWTGSRHQTHVVTLQHDRGGRVLFLCKVCNVRHARFPGDTFYDYPLDWKHCPKCNTTKPPEAFYFSPARNALKPYCKDCKHVIAKHEWQQNKLCES